MQTNRTLSMKSVTDLVMDVTEKKTCNPFLSSCFAPCRDKPVHAQREGCTQLSCPCPSCWGVRFLPPNANTIASVHTCMEQNAADRVLSTPYCPENAPLCKVPIPRYEHVRRRGDERNMDGIKGSSDCFFLGHDLWERISIERA